MFDWQLFFDSIKVATLRWTNLRSVLISTSAAWAHMIVTWWLNAKTRAAATPVHAPMAGTGMALSVLNIFASFVLTKLNAKTEKLAFVIAACKALALPALQPSFHLSFTQTTPAQRSLLIFLSKAQCSSSLNLTILAPRRFYKMVARRGLSLTPFKIKNSVEFWSHHSCFLRYMSKISGMKAS